MKPVQLESAAIASVQYDEAARSLEVKFRDGDTYEYFNVPRFVYEELLQAESAGAFWNSVKGQYRFERIA